MRLSKTGAPRRKPRGKENYLKDIEKVLETIGYQILNYGVEEPMVRKRRNDEERTWACR